MPRLRTPSSSTVVRFTFLRSESSFGVLAFLLSSLASFPFGFLVNFCFMSEVMYVLRPTFLAFFVGGPWFVSFFFRFLGGLASSISSMGITVFELAVPPPTAGFVAVYFLAGGLFIGV